jgi:hypothetical protein
MNPPQTMKAASIKISPGNENYNPPMMKNNNNNSPTKKTNAIKNNHLHPGKKDQSRNDNSL